MEPATSDRSLLDGVINLPATNGDGATHVVGEKKAHAVTQSISATCKTIKALLNTLDDSKRVGLEVACTVKTSVGYYAVDVYSGNTCGNPATSAFLRKVVQSVMAGESIGAWDVEIQAMLSKAFGEGSLAFATMLLKLACSKNIITQAQTEAVLQLAKEVDDTEGKTKKTSKNKPQRTELYTSKSKRAKSDCTEAGPSRAEDDEVMSPLKTGRPEIVQLPTSGPATGGAADSHVAAGQTAGECSNLQDQGAAIFCAVADKELAAPPANAVAVAPSGVPVRTSVAAVSGIAPPAPPAPPAMVPGTTAAGNTSENPSQNRAPVVIAAASGPPGHSASLAVGETPLEGVAVEEAVAPPGDGRRRGQRTKKATQGMDDFVVETVQQPQRVTSKPSRGPKASLKVNGVEFNDEQVATLKSIIETCHAEAFKTDTRAKGYTLAVVKACESQIPTLFQALMGKPENARFQKVRDLKEKYFPDAFPYEVAAKEQREAIEKAASSVRGAAEADAFGIPPASKGAMTATAHWTALIAYIEAFENEKMGWRDDKKADGYFLSEKAKQEAKFAFERVAHWSEEHRSHKPRIQKFGLRLRMASRPEALTLIPAAPLQEPEPAADGPEPATGVVQSGEEALLPPGASPAAPAAL